MDLGRGVRFPMMDPQWISKVIVGSLITLVPILNFAATGYMLDALRNVVAGRETPLPEWDDLGSKFIRGLLGVVIQFLWTLPVLLLACPIWIVAIASSAASPDGEPGAAAGLLIACLGLLIAVVSIALVPFTFVALSRYAVTNDFNAALPGPVWRQLRGNWGSWLAILLALFGLGLAVGIVAVCTFGLAALLLIPFSFYLQLVQAHWLAQAYMRSSSNRALPPSMV